MISGILSVSLFATCGPHRGCYLVVATPRLVCRHNAWTWVGQTIVVARYQIPCNIPVKVKEIRLIRLYKLGDLVLTLDYQVKYGFIASRNDRLINNKTSYRRLGRVVLLTQTWILSHSPRLTPESWVKLSTHCCAVDKWCIAFYFMSRLKSF